MADFDRRSRGGGRGGRPFNNYNDYSNNNRKRRFRDDDYEDRRPQRRRYEEPLSVGMRKQLLSIAESPVRRVEEDVSNIAKTIAENYFDTDLTSSFLNLAIQMTAEQPLKIPFLASVILIANIQKPEFTTEVLTTLGTTLQKHIEAGEWREVKLYLRLLGCLQGLFEGDGVFSVLEDLFSRAVDLQTESSDDSLGLELVKIILLTIPYTMASSATGLQDQANALLDKTEVIASTPHALESLVDPYPSLDTPDVTSSESSLALLQKHMQEEARNGWELSFLPRSWRQSFEGDEDPLTTAQKHPLPVLTIPEKVALGPRSIYPEIYFSVYADQELETVPRQTDSACLIIRDVLTDAINVLHFNRSVAARFLIDVDCYFAPDTFVKRGTAFDKLREMAGDKSTWKPEDVVVDAAFANLFQLPTPEHKLVYYHSVITEACKIAPAAVAPSLGRAIRYLYRNVDRMDQELSHRFLDWFAHHLSNFGFTWKWIEWVEDVELPQVHPKRAFISAALDKEIRLSFAQRIKGTLPEPYHALISTEKEKDSPDFKFNDDAVPYAAQGRELAQLIRTKESEEAFDTTLSAIRTAAAEAGGTETNPDLLATDALVTAICWVGSKSLSHVLNVIDRYRQRLSAISEETGGKKQIVSAVMDYWREHPGVGVNIVDKMVNFQIITPQTVLEWALTDNLDRGTALARAWMWELAVQVLDKVVGRVRHVVAAMRRPGLPEEQIQILKEALEREMKVMRDGFGLVADACVAVEKGYEDGMMEASDRLQEEEGALIRGWGARWRRAVQRRLRAVEVGVVEELARPLPEVEEVVVAEEKTGDEAVGKEEAVKADEFEKVMGLVNGNGNGNGNENGTTGRDGGMEIDGSQ